VIKKLYLLTLQGWNSVNSVPIRYGLDGPEIESRWGRDFRTCPPRLWGPPSLLYKGYRFIARG